MTCGFLVPQDADHRERGRARDRADRPPPRSTPAVAIARKDSPLAGLSHEDVGGMEVYNATGKRIRDLPITLDKLL